VNFLAHCLIPDRAAPATHPDLIAGGYIGDFLKGPVPETLPGELALGIRLHRRIDAYSNRQPLIRRSCARFPPHLRRFAPIFVDIIADHLLASHWGRFHPDRLPDFTSRAYRAIRARTGALPEPGRRFFEYMSERDLLASYVDPAVMLRALESVTRRLNRPQLNDGLEAIVRVRLAELEQDFLEYFPDLLSHAAGWLSEHALAGDAEAG
jgi:acyl carrier protein phosphodiesterase